MNQWYSLRVAGVSDTNIKALLKITKNYDEIFKIDKEQMNKYLKFSSEEIEKIYNSKDIELKKEVELLKEKDIGVIFIEDSEYPDSLKNISSPPIFLYYKGDIELLKKFSIAVVGTRNATSYGRVVCEKMTLELIKSEVVTVSGVASGIDSICHKKTIEKNGKTIGVVGSGLDIVYPRENRELWENIGKKGLLISEYPLGTQPVSYHFPLRNRIIVGISKGVLIVESKEKGGSLITAHLALEEGREVFAIPGEIFSDFSTGCNTLIKNSQAKLVTKIDDILNEYGMESNKGSAKNIENIPKLSVLEEKIYKTLNGVKTLDEILLDVNEKAGEILAALIDLEMKGLVMSTPGGGYRKKEVF